MRRTFLPAILALSSCVADPSDYPIDANPFPPPDAALPTPDGAADFIGTIVPLYSYPTEAPWAAVAAAAEALPDARIVVIANPDNGPGIVFDPHYADGITLLQAAGVTVIGYVYTQYSDRNAGQVEDDIDAWAAYYPTVDGIFFDEMSTDAADIPYYQQLDAHATAAGLDFTVGNPGTDSIPDYVGVVDVLVVYESAGLPSGNDFDWHAAHAPDNFAIIPYAVTDPTGIAAFRDTIRWIYATDDDLPNPWDTLPAYFEQLLTE